MKYTFSCIIRDRNPISIDRLMMAVEKCVGDFYFHSGDNLREIGDLQKKTMVRIKKKPAWGLPMSG